MKRPRIHGSVGRAIESERRESWQVRFVLERGGPSAGETLYTSRDFERYDDAEALRYEIQQFVYEIGFHSIFIWMGSLSVVKVEQ